MPYVRPEDTIRRAVSFVTANNDMFSDSMCVNSNEIEEIHCREKRNSESPTGGGTGYDADTDSGSSGDDIQMLL